ncbi:MAG TPA: type I restriction endonuclease subunit R [Anaerolineae bacterium]|nr:type I restriction endonuclease subunit R [Anaerolineae bacterium]
MSKLLEDTVEQAALQWLQTLGYTYTHGPTLAPDSPTAERASYRDVLLVDRLRAALGRLNPTLPPTALDDALRQIKRAESPNLASNNHRFHQLLVNGVTVSYQGKDGRAIHKQARLLDYDNVHNNDWLAVNQFSILQQNAIPDPNSTLQDTLRPDIILFVNGLPLAVIELKGSQEQANIHTAYKQLGTYKQGIPDLFIYNCALVIADNIDARLGTLTSGMEWFKRWRSIDGINLDKGMTKLECLIRGVFAPHHFLNLIRYFIIFERRKETIIKKMAGYHQYHAVNKAVAATAKAIQEEDGKVGVVWHTQGSGKSLSMAFYAGRIVQEPQMANPTLIILTDRNDLDDQLFDTFAACHELLRQEPTQAQSRVDLRDKLQVASGGVVFTTIQKFLPEGDATEHPILSERQNIIFIVDEAHRTQYGLEVNYIQKEDGVHKRYGLAKYMRDALPNAAFIGFTGTPVSAEDRNTRGVFGEYIDIYDIQRAVEDQATVPIYYEARHAKLKLNERYVPQIDPKFEEITEGEEAAQKELIKSKWAALAAIVGEPDRIATVAQDIVNHYEARNASLPGKAMVVCMSRAICIQMHDAIAALRPDWVGDIEDDNDGVMKVIMTGASSDGPEWAPHIRTSKRRKALAERFRDKNSDFRLVIVRDMWLTGFDAPSLHTMYLDKPMKGHNLMQAIARVNRVFPQKDGGLVVAYLPLQTQLQEALKDYTEGDRSQVGQLQEQAVAIMMEKYEIVRAMMHGFDDSDFFTDEPTKRLTTLNNAVEHISAGRSEMKKRFTEQVMALGRAFSLANPHEQALAIRDRVGFYQVVRAALVKLDQVPGGEVGQNARDWRDVDQAVQEIVDRAVAPDGIVDLFAVNRFQYADLSIISDEFLTEVRALPQKNVAVELLRRLIDDEIKQRRRGNLVQARSFAEMLRQTLERYNDQQISAALILNELVALAKEIQAAQRRGEELGLNEDELAFYDALETNDSAVKILGDETLIEIAQTLVKQVRANISIDWALKEDARARMRVAVKRVLRKYGYPPDKQKQAMETVVAQAELMSNEWSNK